MKVILNKKGQITIPLLMRLNWYSQPGDVFEVKYVPKYGLLEVHRVTRRGSPDYEQWREKMKKQEAANVNTE